MLRTRLPSVLTLAWAISLLAGATAIAATAHRAATPGGGSFSPRIGRAMGIVPPVTRPEVATGPRQPLVFHGGAVMHGVHVHTVFWAPSGYAFTGAPAAGVLGYEQLQQRSLSDVAHDSGSAGNIFSLISQYGDGGAAGTYSLSYDPAVDSINDPQPYPATAQECRSPAGLVACVTDLQIEQELDRVIAQQAPSARGLHDLWIVYLPPGVDTCAQRTQCGTNAFAGYHSLFDLGHGTTVYAVVVDPIIEGVYPPGSDPQGNPDGELATNVTAHEVVEAVTDPEGTGWMDPNGFEAGDKCDAAIGAPLGFSANGSPFNQLLNGRQYLVQTMWSNVSTGCVQSGPAQPPPVTPRVYLQQFSDFVSGNMGQPRAGVDVLVGLVKGGVPYAIGLGRTAANGSWHVTLRSVSTDAAAAVGDDRDVLVVSYGGEAMASEVIATDSGGNPFTEAGWTGWFDLDTGYAVGSHAVALAPCGQAGVLALRIDTVLTPSPVEQCQTETDAAVIPTKPIGLRTAISLASTDNRAAIESSGALVKLAIKLGEPGSVPALTNGRVLLETTGFPTCSADLRAQTERCSGLVRRALYTLTRTRGHAARRARVNASGVARFASFSGPRGVMGGDLLTLSNRAGRAVTALHVAHLRVAVRGSERVLTGGTCQAGDYWGGPVDSAPVGLAVGSSSIAGSGTICPPDGKVKGLPSATIEQADSLSGGTTSTAVPQLQTTSPTPGETLYGPFIAIAQPVMPGSHGGFYSVAADVTLTISQRGSSRVLRRLTGVQRPQGVTVTGLVRGVYTATWTVTDANGDTRTTDSYFIQR